MSEKQSKDGQKNRGLILSAMGVELVGIILGCVYLGSYLDKEYGWKGMGVAGLSILGLVGWLVHIVQILKILEKSAEEQGSAK